VSAEQAAKQIAIPINKKATVLFNWTVIDIGFN